MSEIWKTLPGYEGLYEVSDHGGVRSLDRLVARPRGGRAVKKGRVLSPAFDSGGYLVVSLCIDGAQRTKKIHRLVALAFIGESELQVNHIDCCKTNNNISNLEYVTRQQNVDHAVANGRYHGATNPNMSWKTNPNLSARTNPNMAKKLTPALVSEIKMLRETGLSYRAIGKQLGIGHTTARGVCNGTHWK